MNFTAIGHTRAQKTWDLFNEGIRSDEGVVLASQFLDQLLRVQISLLLRNDKFVL